MLFLKNFLNIINFDAPHAWGIYFQDSATPQMEGLVELHDFFFFCLCIKTKLRINPKALITKEMNTMFLA